jgi:hypothetical protein
MQTNNNVTAQILRDTVVAEETALLMAPRFTQVEATAKVVYLDIARKVTAAS